MSLGWMCSSSGIWARVKGVQGEGGQCGGPKAVGSRDGCESLLLCLASSLPTALSLPLCLLPLDYWNVWAGEWDKCLKIKSCVCLSSSPFVYLPIYVKLIELQYFQNRSMCWKGAGRTYRPTCVLCDFLRHLGKWTKLHASSRNFCIKDSHVSAHCVCLKLHLPLMNIKGETSFL